MIDTHCHLYLDDFRDDLDTVILRAKEEGVTKFYLPAIDSESTPAMLKLEAQYPGVCFSMMGLHPCSVRENFEEELQFVKDRLFKHRFAAVGEIGLDFYWDKTFLEQQFSAFNRQVEWALELALPIVIHSRDSLRECIDVVKSHQKGNLRGIFHCFSGDYDSAVEIIDAGFYLGIGGVVTYKNAGLAEALVNVPLEHMVLETDAPYLTPVPFRGKRNESSYLKYVVEKLAELKSVSREEVAAITTANAEKIFGG
jgi:TatD DNase family protein